MEAALDELTYALDTFHADGVVMYSNYAGIYLGDSRFAPCSRSWIAARRSSSCTQRSTPAARSPQLPTARNAGSPIPTLPGFMLEFVFDATRAVSNLVLTGTLKRQPRVRIILSHAGGTVPYVAHKLVSGGLWMTFAPLLSAAGFRISRSSRTMRCAWRRRRSSSCSSVVSLSLRLPSSRSACLS